MWRSVWISSIAAILLGAPWAQGQEDETAADTRTEIKLGDYWLGVSCRPVDGALRTQLRLPEHRGLVVEQVMPESPAAGAGVKRHDVLLKAGETPLSELPDLIDAVEQAKDSELALELVRGGKRKTIKLTPAKRPENAMPKQPWNVPPEGIDPRQIHRWIPRIELDQWTGPLEFRFIRPGALLPKALKVHPPLPGNVGITINKQGGKPTKIVVTKDDQKWEVTEENLDELPEELRPHVKRLLGRINFTAPLDKIRTFDFVPRVVRPDGAKPRIEQRVLPHPVRPEEFHKQHQEQIEEINRQMEELRKSFDELRKNMPERDGG